MTQEQEKEFDRIIQDGIDNGTIELIFHKGYEARNEDAYQAIWNAAVRKCAETAGLIYDPDVDKLPVKYMSINKVRINEQSILKNLIP